MSNEANLEKKKNELQTSEPGSRRHDLDALRAIAMLLGIGLHGAMSFFVSPWPVHDSELNDLYGLFVLAIHGFRMQLFFVLTGFFTAMVWRRKGVQALVVNRVQRVLIPCLLGLLTVIPLFGWVSTKVAAPPSKRANRTVGDVNELDKQFGVTPLAWAAMEGDLKAAQDLIAKGAKVNGRNTDGSTPLHGAAFMGQEPVVRLLLAKGADPALRNTSGLLPTDSAKADSGTTQYLIGLLGLPAKSNEEIAAGRAKLLPLLPSLTTPAASKGIQETYTDWIHRGPLSPLIGPNVFNHLWFLWYVCFFVALFAPWAMLRERRPMPAEPSAVPWITSPRRILWLIPLTLIPQYFMGTEGYSFGPDTSTGWLPPIHLLAYYGIYFAFGVMYFGAKDEIGSLGRHWKLALPIALLLLLPLGLATMTGNRPVSDLLQVSYAWLMVTGSIGLFRAVFSRPSPALRYISDASYWMYVIHLPLIVALQGLVAPWPLAAIIKFLLVNLVSFGLLLLSYKLCVRNSSIGVLLNGKRISAS